MFSKNCPEYFPQSVSFDSQSLSWDSDYIQVIGAASQRLGVEVAWSPPLDRPWHRAAAPSVSVLAFPRWDYELGSPR